ncbi:MAG: translation initiation factor IF-2 N-terminal domain-containing protein, partial [Thermomicrobiales bacterium]
MTLPSVMSVSEMAEFLQIGGVDVIKELMKLGIMANLNQQIDYDTAGRVATALGFETNERVSEVARQAANFESRRAD